MNYKLSKHANHERAQQRAIPARIYELAAFAEEVKAPRHAQCLYFSRRSVQRMRAAGVCQKDIDLVEKKKNLRVIASGGNVITVMYAHQSKKRIKDYDH